MINNLTDFNNKIKTKLITIFKIISKIFDFDYF